MIQAQGLGHFYDLRQGISAPVNAQPLAPDAFDWLPAVATQAEAAAYAQTTSHATATLTLPLDGIHCVGCRWLIGELFAQQPCHDRIEVDAQAHEVRLGWHLPQAAGEPHFDITAFAVTLAAFGYTLENPALPRKRQQTGSLRPRSPESALSLRKHLIPRLLLCGVFALNAVIFALPLRLGASAETYPFLRLFGLLVVLCATLSTGLSASYFLQKRPGTNTAGSTLPRTLLGLLLIAACLASFAAPSLGLPALFAPDTAAAASFTALLIAFIAKR